MGTCLHKEVLWTCMLSSVCRCLLYLLAWVIFNIYGAWICVHVMDQRETFAAVVICMWRNLTLLFKQSFSDSQTRCENSEKDAGSDAKLVVSSNSFCRASFCWLESLHLKCNYPDVENKTGIAQPYQKRGNFLRLPLHHQQCHVYYTFQIKRERLELDPCVNAQLHSRTALFTSAELCQ